MTTGTGTPSPRVAYASALGCKLDVDLATGRTRTGAPATDNTGALNAFLETASEAHPVKLILDGPALVHGLVIAAEGHTAIEGLGWDTGIYLADGANGDAIRIGVYTGGQTEGQGVSPAPPRAASNITLRDFAIFGNGQRSATGPRQGTTPPEQPVPGAPQHAMFGVALTNCTGVSLDHVRFVDAPCYAVMLANAADVSIANCQFESGHNYQDGIHINGPAERVLISGCRFATGDDAVALNAPEGFGGNIEDVHVTDCIAENSLTMMRVYTSLASQRKTYRVRRVSVAQCAGTTQTEAFDLGIQGNEATALPDQIEDMLITGCSFTAPGFATLQTAMGSLTLRDCTYRAPKAAVPLLTVKAPGARDLLLAGVTLLRTADGDAPAPFVATEAAAAISRITLAGVRVVEEGEASYTAVPCVLQAGGKVARLQVEGVDMDRIAMLVGPPTGWAGVEKVGGAGLLGTGALVPDEKVGENTLYFSAPTGELSIRAGGTLRRLGSRAL